MKIVLAADKKGEPEQPRKLENILSQGFVQFSDCCFLKALFQAGGYKSSESDLPLL